MNVIAKEKSGYIIKVENGYLILKKQIDSTIYILYDKDFIEKLRVQKIKNGGKLCYQ